MTHLYRMLLLFLAGASPAAMAQSWTHYSNTPVAASRMDDIYFFNSDTGLVIAGHYISKTTDGGQNWQTVLELHDSTYFRSLEFNGDIGYAGTLNGLLYQSFNKGESWQEISSRIPAKVNGFCGIAIPDPGTVYTCGVYSGNPFVAYSADTGRSWTYTALDSLCSALVETVFTSAAHGYACGRSSDYNRGIILETSDSGKTWHRAYTTKADGDEYIWKLNKHDGRYFFASIYRLFTNNTRIVMSADSGKTWFERSCSFKGIFNSDDQAALQMIGFINPAKGFIGGHRGSIFETSDSGYTWRSLPDIGTMANRFMKISDRHAVLCGKTIWHYREKTSSLGRVYNSDSDTKPLHVYPNPIENGTLSLEFESEQSLCEILLYTVSGKYFKTLYRGYAYKGLNRHSFDLGPIPAGQYIISVQTNTGSATAGCIVQ